VSGEIVTVDHNEGIQTQVDQPSLARLLEVARDAGIAQIHTQIPGVVVDYDESSHTASIQPCVFDDTGNWNPIVDVPVCFPGGALFRIVFPLAPGDEGTLHFYELDPSAFQVTAVPSKADHVRRHGLYAEFQPGPRSDPRLATIIATAGALCIGAGTGLNDIIIDQSSITFGTVAALDAPSMALKVDANFAALAVYLAAHVHPPGLPPVAPPPPPIPTGSLRVKIDL
jgi:hypothetical protein